MSKSISVEFDFFLLLHFFNDFLEQWKNILSFSLYTLHFTAMQFSSCSNSLLVIPLDFFLFLQLNFDVSKSNIF